ncbi:hypothetical protein ACXO7J_04545 [Lactobacillus delbrueckii subsp. bulgaricus]
MIGNSIQLVFKQVLHHLPHDGFLPFLPDLVRLIVAQVDSLNCFPAKAESGDGLPFLARLEKVLAWLLALIRAFLGAIAVKLAAFCSQDTASNQLLAAFHQVFDQHVVFPGPGGWQSERCRKASFFEVAQDLFMLSWLSVKPAKTKAIDLCLAPLVSWLSRGIFGQQLG